MSVLYVTQREAILSKVYEAFNIALKQQDGSWKKKSIPAQTVNQVVLMGNPQVTGGFNTDLRPRCRLCKTHHHLRFRKTSTRRNNCFIVFLSA